MLGTEARGIRKRRRGAALAEFGPVLWMFLIVFVIPFFDLISFGSAVGTIMYVASMGAHMAGGAQTFTDAINTCKKLEADMQPFLQFAKTTPIDPNGSASTNGVTLSVVISPVDGSAGPPPYTQPGTGNGNAIPNQTPDPNDPNPPQYNTNNCVYQYLVTCRYNVMPLFNFYGTPLLRDVPALGKPVPVTYSATAPVEHVEGLNN